MALWSPPSPPISRPSKGLAQPDDLTWNAYLPDNDLARVLPRKAELDTIESTSLWVPPPNKVEEPTHQGLWGTTQKHNPTTTLPAMWSQPPILQKPTYGLPQPDAETWATYLVVMDDVPRAKPREPEPAFVQSTSLWTTPSKPVIAEDDSAFSDGLWSASSAASSTASSPTEPSTPRETVNFGLWEPIPATDAVEEEEPKGLFSLSHRRTDFRTTKLPPAGLDMERRPRKPLEPYPDFGFTHLWNQAPLWDAAANAAAVQSRREMDELVLEGLFSLNHRRYNFRTTSEPAAALATRPKMRISQDPLPTLNSDRLWSVRPPSEAPVEIDWLALSTAGPRSVASSTTTDNDSLASMLPSTTSTRASSVKSEVSYAKAVLGGTSHRFDATPDQWLDALDDAIRASSLDFDLRGQSSSTADKDASSLDHATIMGKDKDLAAADLKDPYTLESSSNYQLWSKPLNNDVADSLPVSSQSMWKPSSSPATPRYLELTPSLNDEQSASTSRHNRNLELPRLPPPIVHGSSVSAFLPAVSETPRDFSAQSLWTRAESPALGDDDASWLSNSLRKSMSRVQLW